MELNQLTDFSKQTRAGSFMAVNFGCRVNSAEINQLSQILINHGFSPSRTHPKVILINTCSVTSKGEYESISKIKKLSRLYPKSQIIVTGCADISRLSRLPNVTTFDNDLKETILHQLSSSYTPKVADKFSRTRRFLLRIQSGCAQFCSYCIVPKRRPRLWSLPPNDAVYTVNKAIADGYREVIVTGVNLDQYLFGFTNLVEVLLNKTPAPLISFGSIPLNRIDDKFLRLISRFPLRLSRFLHIPIQSGSDKILKLMHRPYDRKKITDTFNKLKQIASLNARNDVIARSKATWQSLSFGTDIIVGFPGETDIDFRQTYDLCRQIGFAKIHTFRFSPRPGTLAAVYHQKYPKLLQEIIDSRSRQIRSLVSPLTANENRP